MTFIDSGKGVGPRDTGPGTQAREPGAGEQGHAETQDPRTSSSGTKAKEFRAQGPRAEARYPGPGTRDPGLRVGV